MLKNDSSIAWYKRVDSMRSTAKVYGLSPLSDTNKYVFGCETYQD